MGYGVMVAGDGRGLFVFVYLRLGVTNIMILYFPPLNNNILTNYKTEEFSLLSSISVETLCFFPYSLLHKITYEYMYIIRHEAYLTDIFLPTFTQIFPKVTNFANKNPLKSWMTFLYKYYSQ